jgi:hypothetical protein
MKPPIRLARESELRQVRAGQLSRWRRVAMARRLPAARRDSD